MFPSNSQPSLHRIDMSEGWTFSKNWINEKKEKTKNNKVKKYMTWIFNFSLDSNLKFCMNSTNSYSTHNFNGGERVNENKNERRESLSTYSTKS